MPLQDGNQFPAQIKGIPHGHIHALSCLGAVGVTGVARHKNAGRARANFVFWHVIKAVGQSVADLINGPPNHLFHIQRMGMQNALCFGDDVLFA